MNERGSELYHIIGELITIGNMLQSEKNQMLVQQAIYSTTVAVDIHRTATVTVDIRRLQLFQSTFVDHISDTGCAPLA